MLVQNKKAAFEYTIVDRIEAGAVLVGAEVKSLRLGHGKLDGAFVKIMGGEAYLINATISPYAFADPDSFEPQRTRKLLVRRRELVSLASRLDSAKLTLIPLSWYTKGPHIKLEIGLARGKKQFEKRELKKNADIKRELEIDFRGKIK
jgi:SsrA-binding protein